MPGMAGDKSREAEAEADWAESWDPTSPCTQSPFPQVARQGSATWTLELDGDLVILRPGSSRVRIALVA